MSLGLTNKNILVTGAAKGIGRGITFAAANEGANIALHFYSSEKEAIDTANEINKLGVKVCLVKGDLSYLEDVKQMQKEIKRELGSIDYIVNNAGYTQIKSFFKYEPDEWKREVEVCLYGIINLVHTFMPEMISKERGKFLNIIGDSARTGDRNLIISAAARGGAISFLKSLAKEVGKSNIQCNTVSLGLIDQGTLPFDEIAMGKIIKQYPLNRLGKVEDVTGATLFFLSEYSNWITGQVISVNGGSNVF
jgi:NAD(P)-dependent dehydrogenase (short-subunit alcohol dehydrogenase family)